MKKRNRTSLLKNHSFRRPGKKTTRNEDIRQHQLYNSPRKALLTGEIEYTATSENKKVSG